jgi:hypothetical protein
MSGLWFETGMPSQRKACMVRQFFLPEIFQNSCRLRFFFLFFLSPPPEKRQGRGMKNIIKDMENHT